MGDATLALEPIATYSDRMATTVIEIETHLTALHECAGRRCEKPARLRRSVELGCGCTRHECDRHDGAPGVHFLTGGCGRHDADEVTFS